MSTLYLVRHGHMDKKNCFIGKTDLPLSPLGKKHAEDMAELLRNVPFGCCLCSPLQRCLETARIIVGENTSFIQGFHNAWHTASCETLDKSEDLHPFPHDFLPIFQGEFSHVVHEEKTYEEKGRHGEKERHGEKGWHDEEGAQKKNYAEPHANGYANTHDGGFVRNAFENIPLYCMDELQEISLGVWEGLSKEIIKERYPKLWEQRGLNMALTAPPDGENYAMLAKRLEPVVCQIKRLQSFGNILLIGHRSVNQVLMGQWRNLPMKDWPLLSIPYGSVSLCPL